jgi:hypothetical protein
MRTTSSAWCTELFKIVCARNFQEIGYAKRDPRAKEKSRAREKLFDFSRILMFSMVADISNSLFST